MNQTIVVDVIEPWHTISRTTVEPTMWQVTAHGDNDFEQLIDLFDTLDEAEEAYPDAVTLPNGEPDSDWDKAKRRIWNEAKTNPSYKDHN